MPPIQRNTMYLGMPFDLWLRHVYLPSVVSFLDDGTRGGVPAIKIGLAALREYDYHSYLPGSGRLINACRRLHEGLSSFPHAFAPGEG